MQNKGSNSTNETKGVEVGSVEPEVLVEGERLRQAGGGDAEAVVAEVGVIKDPEDAVFVFEELRQLITWLKDCGIGPDEIYSALLAGAVSFGVNGGELERASEALSPFPLNLPPIQGKLFQ